jgi:hypothetical protein
MIPLDAKTVTFGEITFQGQPVLHSEMRIDHKTIPRGLYVYEVRHADDDFLIPRQICKRVLVNFYGTLITAKPLHLPPEGLYLDKPYDFENAEIRSLDEFMTFHRIKPKAKDTMER